MAVWIASESRSKATLPLESQVSRARRNTAKFYRKRGMVRVIDYKQRELESRKGTERVGGKKGRGPNGGFDNRTGVRLRSVEQFLCQISNCASLSPSFQWIYLDSSDTASVQ